VTGAPPALHGRRVTRRAPGPSDADDRLAAGRDPERRRTVGATRASPGPLTRVDAERRHAEPGAEPRGWVVALDEGSARLAIGRFAPGHRGHALGTASVRLLPRHAFDAPAVACYARYRFREVAREPIVSNGARVDDVWTAITVAAWRADAAPR